MTPPDPRFGGQSANIDIRYTMEYPLRPILAGGGNMPNMANLAYIVP